MPYDDWKAYEMLLRKQINEDRLLSERNSLFFVSSSFLFVGFIALNSEALFLRIIIPIIGLFLCLIISCLNRLSTQALGYWHTALNTIEDNSKFIDFYNKGNIKLRPGPSIKQQDRLTKIEFLSHPNIYERLIPAAFSILWLCTLIWVIWPLAN